MDIDKLVRVSEIQNRIFTIRDLQVMVDRDLAEMYAVPTKRLNEQVKRNIDRFPKSFRFQLTQKEKTELVANCDRFEKLKHATVLPYVFTEQGIAMLSAVLRSDIAIKVSVQIMNAFVEMRKFLSNNAGIFQRLEKVEQKQLVSDEKFEQLFKAFDNKNTIPENGLFYDGQIFDAYTLAADIIRKAKKSIVLIDNYVDDTVLTLLTKREKTVTATIYTKTISKQLKLDLEKYNAQYPIINIKLLNNIHDRFLIIDDTLMYHIGASLKDLGKKLFAFSKMDAQALNRIKNIKKASN